MAFSCCGIAFCRVGVLQLWLDSSDFSGFVVLSTSFIHCMALGSRMLGGSILAVLFVEETLATLHTTC